MDSSQVRSGGNNWGRGGCFYVQKPRTGEIDRVAGDSIVYRHRISSHGTFQRGTGGFRRFTVHGARRTAAGWLLAKPNHSFLGDSASAKITGFPRGSAKARCHSDAGNHLHFTLPFLLDLVS